MRDEDGRGNPAWHEPADLEAALELRAELGIEATVVAGGTFVGVLMATGMFFPEQLLSLRNLDELRSIAVGEDGALELGAMTTHRRAERAPVIVDGWPALARTFSVVASPRIRNQATVGGVVADADYASDPPAMLVALDARARLVGPDGTREVSIDDMIVGHYETTIAADELVTHVIVPPRPGPSTYLKFRTRSSEDRPCVGVAASASVAADGTLDELRVAVGAVTGAPQFLADVCADVLGRPLDAAAAAHVAETYADRIEPLSDARGSAAHRTRLIRVLVRRALEQLADDREEVAA